MPHDVGTILAESTDSLGEGEGQRLGTGGVERDVHTGNDEEHLNQIGVGSTIPLGKWFSRCCYTPTPPWTVNSWLVNSPVSIGIAWLMAAFAAGS